jgi:hypothetical protein
MILYTKEVIGTYVQNVKLVSEETQEELVMLMLISVRIVKPNLDLLVPNVLQENMQNV